MRKLAVAILFVLAGFTTLARQHKTKKSRSGVEITSVICYHTACYGRCPTFKVDVNKDGTATYTGVRFTHDSGVFKKNIGKAKAARILNAFKTFRADTCKDRYESRAQDLPGVVLTINYAGKTKMIQNSNLGPVGLMRIGSAIDSIVIGGLDDTWHRADVNDK